MSADVTTTNGPIHGEGKDGIAVFRGVRYGASPAGDRRFRSPVAPEPWTERTDCTRFGPIAPQPATPLDVPGDEGVEQSEDCLFLNVFTPACDEARRPVLFWLYGGGFTIGAGSSEGYDGTRFAKNHDVVVVTINYRLGALFFSYLAELGEEYASSGNAGLLDQVLALEWVRDNIATFGGDPGNVTVFGESAGGRSVSCLMAMPLAAGLFHKAIAESGAHIGNRPVEHAQDVTSRLCAELGSSVEELVTMPVDKLLAAQSVVAVPRSANEGLPFGPVVDDGVLPEPVDGIGAGSAASVPLLIGTNLDEFNLFALMVPSAQELDRDGLVERMEPLLGDHTARAIDTYRAGRPELSDTDVWNAVMTDRSFRVNAVRMAQQQSKHAPTFVYLFCWPTPVMGGRLGACHGLEIAFVFNTVDRESVLIPPVTPVMERLSEEMHAAWAAFARSGDPNHAGLPPWPTYDASGRQTMVFAEHSSVETDPYGEELALWD
jgi:para-nitrobenzyl esterase